MKRERSPVAQRASCSQPNSPRPRNSSQHPLGVWAFLIWVSGAALGCDEKKETEPSAEGASEPADEESLPRPKNLYLPTEEARPDLVDLNAPDAHVTDSVTFGPGAGPLPLPSGSGRCPPDMVDVAGAFCIDRYEVSLVDAKTGRELSPHYPPNKERAVALFELWSRRAPSSKMALGRRIPVPSPPSFQLEENFAPRALSERGRVPAGYLSRGLSEQACNNAGKRLCSRQEWIRACRGEGNTKFPYGDEYRQGTCNVHRQSHPAALLHGNSSENHLDPRLGLAFDDDGPLLLSTGDNTECVSRWGTDAVYDMVGNLDEWIEDAHGAFVGGFYSRATREGCDASIDSHDPGYIDYSLGTRCCKDQL